MLLVIREMWVETTTRYYIFTKTAKMRLTGRFRGAFGDTA